jgi:hypothetical protein
MADKSKKGVQALKKITAEAKKIRKEKPMKWQDAVKKAAKKYKKA